ncbi:MAG: cytochrome c oxidase assembly protein [Rhodospirillales bacterium]
MDGTGRKRTWTAVILFGVVGGMIGLSFASVPLYRLFCQVTGFGGTPNTRAVAAPDVVSDHEVTVRFDANVNSALPWRFKPEVRQVRVRLGEEVLVHYTATNAADVPVTGTATFNVTPFKAAPYFSKMQCFCFIEQTLAPGEEVAMPVLFYVDPDMLANAEAREVKVITLSYTFYPADKAGTAGGKGREVVGKDVDGRSGG